MGYGDIIREARGASGISQATLGDLIDLDASSVSRLETQQLFPSPETFRALCGALRTLSPANLLNAMGYEVTVPGADRLPRQLVVDLLAMTPDELDAVALLVRRAMGRGHPRVEPAAP